MTSIKVRWVMRHPDYGRRRQGSEEWWCATEAEAYASLDGVCAPFLDGWELEVDWAEWRERGEYLRGRLARDE